MSNEKVDVIKVIGCRLYEFKMLLMVWMVRTVLKKVDSYIFVTKGVIRWGNTY
mgnify:CR=1 FL=1